MKRIFLYTIASGVLIYGYSGGLEWYRLVFCLFGGFILGIIIKIEYERFKNKQ